MDTHTINLLRGWPHPSFLPTAQLAASAQRVLADPRVSEVALQYGDDAGFQPLRDALATWLHGHYGVARDPERLCISGGASQNVACILQAFTDPHVTRAVWVVAPTYHLGCRIFEDAGFAGRLRAFPEDDAGPDVAALAAQLQQFEATDRPGGPPLKDAGPLNKFYRHVIYVVATSANPSGKTMPAARRTDLVRLARRHDALVICDDVYDLLQWPPAPSSSSGRVEADAHPDMVLPRLCDVDLADSRDRFGHAVSNGSFSKLVGPGMRTGWLEGSRAFAQGLAQTGSTKSDGAPSQFAAAVVTDLLASGALEAHLAAVVRPALQRRHRRLVAALERHLAQPLGVRFRPAGLVNGGANGGYFVWLTLPPGLSADAAVAVALASRSSSCWAAGPCSTCAATRPAWTSTGICGWPSRTSTRRTWSRASCGWRACWCGCKRTRGRSKGRG